MGCAVLEDQLDGFTKVLPALVQRIALAVGTRLLQAVPDVPISVLFKDTRKLIRRSLFRIPPAPSLRRAGEGVLEGGEVVEVDIVVGIEVAALAAGLRRAATGPGDAA